MLCTSKMHLVLLGNYLGTSLVIENLMRFRVTSVVWTWLGLGLEWLAAQYVVLYSWWYGEEIIELELTTAELVDVSLGTNYAQDFDLNVDLDSIDVDDVAPPTINLSDAKRHASLLSSFLLKNSLYFWC